MSRPIRCFTCSKVLGNKYEKFDKYKDKEKGFKELGIERYCCMRMLLTSIDTYEFFKHFDDMNLSKQIKCKSDNTLDRVYNAR